MEERGQTIVEYVLLLLFLVIAVAAAVELANLPAALGRALAAVDSAFAGS